MSDPAAVMVRDRLAVLGSPVSHSLSPAIHRAAYRVLGLEWDYDAVDVTGEHLRQFIQDCDGTWRGLSLTMPLKRHILPMLDHTDRVTDLVGAANTVLFSEERGLTGFNTDVHGVVQSFRDVGVRTLDTVYVLGAGATAASVIAGVAQLGARRVLVSARDASRAQVLCELGERLDLDVRIVAWGAPAPLDEPADAVVSTVPGGDHGLGFPELLRRTAALFDVAYDPWPSSLAASWSAVGGTVISGHDLLVNQAVGQIRLFAGRGASEPLPDEPAVIRAMRAALPHSD